MSLRERLNQDLKDAMRAKDQARMTVIRGIKAAILEAETKSQRTTLDDDAIIGVIAKEVKERKETLPEFERGGRLDLVEKLQTEIRILEEYLPTPLTPEEVQALIAEAIRETGASGPRDMGRVMGWLSPKIRGRADGRAVSDLVKAHLQGA
ncbi:MAG: GatB/YqeY domain-containing protein [Sulfobacillus sp.]|nr:GatB/YqeY domain-containing protein [Sulfobacillus sp.]